MIGFVGQIEDYVVYREFGSQALAGHGVLGLIAIALFISGHRMHKMKLVIKARLRHNQRENELKDKQQQP
ncbi:hypothetical protein [Oleiphilus sp. HI0123]|jgi:hypothetical protein|nr:hypothetical protein [Oleiphilus sp. HI0123]KZY37835.1 hypothetical protein A3729_16250 [Oleiphilus sp. HI0043]KZY46053.1 hypothetical protein A3732_08305 [Oleiphilus sp. HI0050]KZY59989.1 hypothetical protein A3735_13505 [Oleiphilus sp. HI0061]KZY78794.1 hypothetical protein A3741_08050 [Oleiphilus sp. HI0069]KZY87706.1 hypothetical protein A3743_13665 [Oleiphilus sp. HI0072]KZZ12848.1 hypothetical protein A3749_06015 [Oleiphilus sp. HI0078]KZZ19223.1 hypothetical protein A3752_15240 [Ol